MHKFRRKNNEHLHERLSAVSDVGASAGTVFVTSLLFGFTTTRDVNGVTKPY